MKIDHKTLSLIIASLCGACASADVNGQDATKSVPMASSGRIGDGATAQPNPIPATPQPMAAPSYQNMGGYGYDPYAVPYGNPVAYHGDHQHAGSYPAYAGGGDDYGYASESYYSHSHASPNVARRSSTFAWVEAESLLWWGKGLSNSPQIVGASPSDPTNLRVLSGGEDSPLGTGLLPGMRMTLGTWLDHDQNYGLSGRVYGLFNGAETNTFGPGGDNTAIRFFNPSFGDDFYVASFQSLLGTNVGTIQESSDLDFLGADLSLRTLMLGDTSSRVDLLFGYSFMRLDSGYKLGVNIVDGVTGNGIPDGTIITTLDDFQTKNEFHGGHIGFGSDITSGRFTLSMLGKVALGNLKQTSTVSGYFTETPPVGLPYAEGRGFFAQPNNIGTVTRDRFTFLPEVGAKLKYQLGRGQLGVGYTLLMMPSVALAPDQIDHNVDVAGIGGVMWAPQPKFSTDTFFLHGLDLGYTLQF